MGKINSKQKGARFERALANKLKDYGYDCRRGCQFNGMNGDADVVGLPHIHIEAKHVERLNIHDAYDQAKRDCKDGLPVVFHKKNNTNILVTMDFDDWMKVYKCATDLELELTKRYIDEKV